MIVAKGLTLPGAMTGIKFAFREKDITLFHPGLWMQAFAQCFYRLGLVPGYHMTLASYNHFNNLIPYDALVVLVIDLLVSLVGIFLTLPLLGHLSETTGLNLENITSMSSKFLFNHIKYSYHYNFIEN